MEIPASKNTPGMTEKKLNKNQGLILVVDDDERNLRLMEALLIPLEYEVMLAENGSKALVMAKKHLPDVVLLDVMMPGLNGFEVCCKLKQDPETAIIPVIMVTSLTGRKDLMAGIKAGATDFISKPVDLPEITIRIKNALNSKLLYDQVQEKNRELKKLERLKDGLTHMIIHDMRSPLMVLKAGIEIMEMDFIENMANVKYLHNMNKSVDILVMMTSSLLDINRLETGKFPLKHKKCDLNTLTRNTLDGIKTLLNKIHVEFQPWEKEVPLVCDPEIIRRIIVNIVGNAVKYTDKNDFITINVVQEKDYGKIYVKDNGPGIPEKFHEKIFNKFGQADVKTAGIRQSYGLGLAFCKLAVDAHGGKIGVKSDKDKGSTFWFSLPVDTQEVPLLRK